MIESDIISEPKPKPKPKPKPVRETKEIYVDDAKAIYELISSIPAAAGQAVSLGNITSLNNTVQEALKEYRKRIL